QQSRREPRADELAKLLPPDVAFVDFLQYRHSSPSNVVTADETPRAIAKENGKVDYQTRLLAFIVRSGRPVAWVQLGGVEPIEKAITEWRQQTKTSSPAAGKKLRRLIWEPLEKHFEGTKTVLVSPDGVLNQLPFAALPGKEAGKYLLEELAVVITPLPRWLPQLLEPVDPAKEHREPSLLLVGDVDFAAAPSLAAKDQSTALAAARAGLFQDWRELPGTRGEIVTVRDSFEQRFPDGKAKALRGGSATEAAIRQLAPQHNILHFATHGFFAPASVKSALG